MIHMFFNGNDDYDGYHAFILPASYRLSTAAQDETLQGERRAKVSVDVGWFTDRGKWLIGPASGPVMSSEIH